MAKPIGKTFVQIDLDAAKYEKGIVDVKTTTKKKLTEIEKAWKGLGKKSEATYDSMRANVNKNYDKIKKHASSSADDIVRAEKAKNDKIAKINKQQFGEQKSWIDKAKKHWMALSAVAVAAVYAIGRAVQKSLSLYADWEVALNRLGNVSNETIPEMRTKILSISPVLGSVTELTKGYYQVLSAGVKEPLKAMDLLTVSAKMSKEATIEQADAVKGIAALMGTYSTELATANDAADLLYKTEALGITTVTELTPLIGNLATQAGAVGLKADEMAAALAQITTTGGGTAISVTQLQSLLTALSKKFALLPPEVKKYGSATEAVKAIGFQGVLEEIMDATGGNSTALIKMLGRQEAYLALLQLSKNEFGSYSQKLEEMTDKTGAFDDAWQRYSITLTAIWETFKNTIGKQAILIGETLAPAIKGIIEVAGEWLGKNEEFITQQVSTYYDAAATSLNAIATALKAIGTAWDAAMGYFLGPNTAIEKHKENIKQAERMIYLLRSQKNHAETMFKATAFGNQVWADAVERINGLIREQRGIIDINKKSIESWNEEAGKKEPETQTKKTTDAIDDQKDAVISLYGWGQKEAEAASAAANMKEIAAKDETQRIKEIFKTQAEATTKGLELLEKGEKDKRKMFQRTATYRHQYIIGGLEAQIQADADATASARKRTDEEYGEWRERALASDSFFAGMKVGFQDMTREQNSWAQHGMALFEDIRDAWQSVINEMVTDFIRGENDKRSVAEISADVMANVAGRAASRAFDAAIDQIIEMIGVFIGQGAAGVAAWAAPKGGVWGAIAEIGTFMATGVGAMLAGRAAAQQFRAGGGWIGDHPSGGIIRGGSGVSDDILLGYTSGARHWGMGGEYVINKESTAKHGALLEAINRDRGMMTGGYIDRRYQGGGPALPWEPVADMLAIGTMFSGAHGFYKGGPGGALAEMITFFATAVVSMFTGKLLANQFRAGGGMVDIGHISIPSPTDIIDIITEPLKGVPVIGETIEKLKEFADFEWIWDYVKRSIRTPLEQVSKDLVTPGKHYSNPIDTITNILGNIKLPSLRQGGILPHTGFFYGHKGEQVITEKEVKGRGSQPIHIHLNLDGREIGLAIVKDGDVVEAMDYQLTKRNKRVYA